MEVTLNRRLTTAEADELAAALRARNAADCAAREARTSLNERLAELHGRGRSLAALSRAAGVSPQRVHQIVRAGVS